MYIKIIMKMHHGKSNDITSELKWYSEFYHLSIYKINVK
jgi:hypothetical protein